MLSDLFLLRKICFALCCLSCCIIFSAEKRVQEQVDMKLSKDIDLPLPEYTENSESNFKKNSEKFKRDPFAVKNYSGDSGGALVPSENAKLPEYIRIVAIIHVKGMKPLAVIDIPSGSKEHLYFIHEGDVIQYQLNSNVGKKKRASIVIQSNDYYLFIKKITKNSVEISPKEKPKETRILR